MSEQKNKADQDLVPCKECLTEIPRSEAKVAEANDYVKIGRASCRERVLRLV